MAIIDSSGVKFLEICEERYKNDLDSFCREVLLVTPSNQQELVLKAMVEGKGRVAVKSGHKVFCVLS